MTIVLVIVGAIFGAFFFYGHSYGNDLGFIPGAILGYLLGSIFKLRAQVTALQKELNPLATSRAEKHTVATPPQLEISATQIEQQRNAELALQEAAARPVEIIKPAPVEASFQHTPASFTIQAVDEPAIFRFLREYFSGPKLLIRVGAVVLFFGVAFLLKYAAARSSLSIEFRLVGVALGALVMLVIGWRLRTRHQDYALVMQGASIGVLYLTVFAALRLYQSLPAGIALVILILAGVFSSILAIVQNARSLAVLGICGGFLAPVLTSTGSGSHVMLFSYYALLNAGIFGMAWFKAWRPLNLVGFLFTFVIATAWGFKNYHSADFASTEPFLILFFLFYVAIAVLYANRQAPELKNYVDGTLVFGTPIISFGLQAGMLQQYEMLQVFEYGLASSAVVLSLFYIVLAKILFDRKRDSLRLMVESFLALGVVFATLAIPLALDGRWTSASWALEGAAVLWMGVRQGRMLPRIFGTLLQFAAGFSLLNHHYYHSTPLAIFNSLYIGCVLISVAGLFCAWYLQRNKSTLHRVEHAVANVLFVWGVLWWVIAGLREIERFINPPYFYNAALLFIALSSFAFSLLRNRISWPIARVPALSLLPAMGVIVLVQMLDVSHPFKGWAFMGWGIAFGLNYLMLYRHENDVSAKTIRVFHVCSLWLLSLVSAWEAAWAIDQLVEGRGTWPLIAWALLPGLMLGALSVAGQRLRWPVAAHLPTYLNIAALPLALFLWLWSLFTNLGSDGNPYPISYIPILNPLDLAQIFVFIVLASWLLKLRQLDMPLFGNYPQEIRYTVIGATLFVWLNASLLRTLHYWADVPFNMHSMMHSVLVQASISIFWSVLALVLMRYAAQKKLRMIWMIGGGLLGAVVLKLFTVDISSSGSLESIVSFIGVAVLMLIVGYVAPLPAKILPTQNDEEAQHV